MHWIVTNRPVRKKRLEGIMVERVDEQVAMASDFRVARFTPTGLNAQTSEEGWRRAVTFVEDGSIATYDGVSPDGDPNRYPGTQRMFLDLYRLMGEAPAGKGDVLFFLHGFNYSWLDCVRHLRKLHEIYVVPETSPIARIVYFSWPSQGSVLQYLTDQRIVKECGWQLGRLFGKLIRFYQDFFSPAPRGHGARYCGRSIHLAAHSMGHQVLEAFAGSVVDYLTVGMGLFREVLLLAPDADWTALEVGKPLRGLVEFSERTHVYNNFSDDALMISEWTKNREKRLGRHGPRDWKNIPPRTVIVDTTQSPLMGNDPAPDLFTMTDAVQSATPHWRERLFDHWGYLYRPAQIEDIHAILRGDSSSDRVSAGARQHVEGPLYRLK